VSPGENVKAKLKGVEEEDISPGFVLCDANNPVSVGKIFDAQVIISYQSNSVKETISFSCVFFILQVVILEHKSIICPGYSAVMHIHCAAEEVNVKVSYLFLVEFTF
jgi:peptide chain release factor subunit 3